MLFFGKRKKKKEPESAPKWFMWMMLGFLAYVLLMSIFTDTVSEAQKAAPSAMSTDEQTKYFNFAVVRPNRSGEVAHPLYMSDVSVGKGANVDCWETVEVRYKLYKDDGTLVEDTTTSERPRRFRIGAGEVPPALERVVLGMQTGGVRAVTANPHMLFADPRLSHEGMESNSYGGYIVTLEAHEPVSTIPQAALELRVYDDKVGEGPLAQCTDLVRMKMRAWKADGSPVWQEQTAAAILVNLGRGRAPYAVERGLMGMKTGGKRTLIAAPEYMQSLFAPTDSPSPEAESAPMAEGETQTPVTPLSKDGFAWQALPAADGVLTIELELLPLALTLPGN